MNELTRRYLEQQAAMGGRELVLEPKAAAPPAPSQAETVTEAPRDRGPSLPTPAAKPPAAAKSGSPDWRVGAPPVPGPGLVIEPPAVDPRATRAADFSDLAAVSRAIDACRACFLCEGRTKTVPGEGNPRAQLMLVGEGPGQTEDQTGRPFVGRAGELLNDILRAIGFAREDVFICNVVKCRPPQNRKPLPDEMAACRPFLDAQIGLVRPKVLLALGATAAEALLGARRGLADLRGKVHSYRGIPLVVTYHPAALLRNPNWKKPTWDDVRIARQLVDR